MRNRDIEQAAKDLLQKMYWAQNVLWPAGAPSPLQMIDPEAAARKLGLRFEICDELGAFGNVSGRFEVAGVLNRHEKEILIKRRFPLPIRRFTAAHEIGHYLLHPGENLHRDRPINGIVDSQFKRPQIEREADYFAACFLVPGKMLIKAFQSRFGQYIPFKFNDASAFALNPQDPETVLRAETGSLERFLVLASARHFDNKYFVPLHQVFNVSVTTMAIRLRELRLVDETY